MSEREGIEPIDRSAGYVEAAPTAVTALLGTCRRGPVDEPVAVSGLDGFDRVYREVRGSWLRRAARDFFANGGRHALTVRLTDESAAFANLAEHDWQLLVVDPRVVDVATAHGCCVRQRAFLVCDAARDGTLPAGLGSSAAAYFPPLAGRRGSRPCAPAVAGAISRIDLERGVWKAPAGADATVHGTLDRELSPQEIEELGLQPVNALRTLPDGRAAIWGARTASSDPEWRHVSTRRLLQFLERSIDRSLRWVVLEPNDERLWAEVRRSVTTFLLSLWRQGAFQGQRAEDGFFVRCDRSTMTQSDIDAGRLVVMVGVAPLVPAEFIVVRIGAHTRSTT